MEESGGDTGRYARRTSSRSLGGRGREWRERGDIALRNSDAPPPPSGAVNPHLFYMNISVSCSQAGIDRAKQVTFLLANG